MPRHDPHLTPLTDDSRTIPPNHPRRTLAFQRVHDPDLIPLWDTLGDGDDELDLIFDGLDDGFGSERGRDVDDRGVGFGFADCIADGPEDGQPEMGLTGFLSSLVVSPSERIELFEGYLLLGWCRRPCGCRSRWLVEHGMSPASESAEGTKGVCAGPIAHGLAGEALDEDFRVFVYQTSGISVRSIQRTHLS